MSCSLPRQTNILTHLKYITFFFLVPELYQVHVSSTEVHASYLIALWYPQEFLCDLSVHTSLYLLSFVLKQSLRILTLLFCMACSHHTHSFSVWFFFSALINAIMISQACVIKFCAVLLKSTAFRSESWSLKLWSCTAQVCSLACVVTRLKMMSKAGSIGIWSSVKDSACLMVAESFPSNKWD